jgi:hypothetical protein
LIDRIDLFKVSNFSLGWTGDCNGFVQQLRGIERVRERKREREKTSKRRGDYASYDTGTALSK